MPQSFKSSLRRLRRRNAVRKKRRRPSVPRKKQQGKQRLPHSRQHPHPEAVQVPVVPVPGILMYLETDHWLIRLQVRGSQVGTATVLRPQQVLPAGMMESILGARQARRSMHQRQGPLLQRHITAHGATMW